MAIPFLNNINLSDNQLLNAKLQVTSTAPTAAVGQIYFDSTAADETAKYYSNLTDTWVSLKEYAFPAGSFITGTITGTTPKPIITFDLSATGSPDDTVYLRGDNVWAPISGIPGTYEFTLSDNANPAVSGVVAGSDTVTIAANSDLTSNLTGQATTSKLLTIGLKVDGTPGVSDNYVVNQNTGVAAADDTIPFNNFTDNANPALITNIVNKTTFGTIPVTALTLVKTYIDESVTGLLQFIGGFDASNGDLDSPLTTNLYTNTALAVGDLYVVSTAGDFFGNAATPLTPGDSVIVQTAAAAGTAVEADFIVVQSDTDLATLTTVGIGNVNEANLPAGTAPELDGLSVVYTSGTAAIGLDIHNLPNFSINPISGADLASLEIPLYNGDTNDSNEKIDVQTLLSAASKVTSYADTITDTATITHSLGTKDVIIQLFDTSSAETVYADVVRASTNTATITFATTPTNSIRVLVQKIG